MKRTGLFLFVVIMLLCPFGANAYESRIVTNSVSVKNGRLFEVEVALKGKGVLTAGAFTLSYDPDDIDYREVSVCVEDSFVKAKNEKGRTKVIFLCGDGVKTDNSPVLFKVKYKTISENSSKIEIKASDCVDGDVKAIKKPAKARCGISIIPPDEKSRSSRGRYYGKSYGSRSAKYSAGSLVEYSKVPEEKVSEKDYEFDVKRESNNYYYITLLVIVAAAVCLVLIALYNDNKKHKSGKSSDDDEK